MNIKFIGGILLLILIVAGVLVLFNNQQVSPSPAVTNQLMSSPSPSSTSLAAAEITIRQSGFSPAKLTIKAGTKVVWRNQSGQLVSINSAVHPTHLLYPALNLGEVLEGVSVELVFDKAGTYKYHNHLNPAQTGEIIVQ